MSDGHAPGATDGGPGLVSGPLVSGPLVSGPLGPLRALGARWAGPASEARPGRGKVNSHVHLPPNFSAFQTVVEASELASAQGVGVLGASNYYDFSVYGPFADKATSLGVFPLFGLEVVCLLEDLRQAGDRVNDPANPGKTYLCGKGITQFAPMNAAAAGLMGTVRSIDSDRIAAMIDKLNGVFARGGVETSLTEGSVKAAVVSRYGVPADTVYLQERHVAQAFQEALFVAVGPGRSPPRWPECSVPARAPNWTPPASRTPFVPI